MVRPHRIAAAALVAAAALLAVVVAVTRSGDGDGAGDPPAAVDLDFRAPVAGAVADRDGEGTGFDGLLPGARHVPERIDLGGGLLTLTTTAGDALDGTQDNALAVRHAGAGAHVVSATLADPRGFTTPYQSAGVFEGSDQGDYVKLVVGEGPEGPRVELLRDAGGEVASRTRSFPALPGVGRVTLSLRVDPAAGRAVGAFAVGDGPERPVGTLAVPPGWSPGRAGVLATHAGTDRPVQVAFDRFTVSPSGVAGGPWRVAAPSPIPRFEAQGVAVGDRLYAFGGFVDVEVRATARSDAFSPGTGRWTRIADMPEPITHAGTAVVGEEVWLAGGFVGDTPGPSTAHVWRYDTAADRWRAGPSLPAPRGGGALVLLGRRLHFFGGGTRPPGRDIDRDHADHWVLDLDAPERWRSAAPLPNPRNHLAGIALGGRAYAIGGQHLQDEAAGNQSSFQAYDPRTDRWAPRAELPVPLGHVAASVLARDGRLVVIGGTSQRRTEVADVIGYDPTADRWTVLGALPEPRQSPIAGIVGDRVVVSTGSIDGVPFRDTWTAPLEAVASPADRIAFAPRRTLAQGGDPGAPGYVEGFRAPTSLALGPGGRLFVAEVDGTIRVFRLDGTAAATLERTITTIRDRPNAAFDGVTPEDERGRQVTGIAFGPPGPDGRPALYVAHSDPGIFTERPPGQSGNDPASGTVTRLLGPAYAERDSFDLVRGLPRSGENHGPNGLAIGPDGWLYHSVAANTNFGSPSPYFSYFPEVPLSGTVVRMRPDRIRQTIDVSEASRFRFLNPCEGDESVGRGCDARVETPTSVEETAGEFEVHAFGFRNGYDLAWHSNGNLYLNENEGNAGFGLTPGPDDGCPDERPEEPGDSADELFLVAPGGFHGHPNPSRGECRRNPPGSVAAIAKYGANASSNGLAEYTGDAFGGALRGQLLTVNYGVGDDVVRVRLSPDGRSVLDQGVVANGLRDPLDVIVGPGGALLVAEIGAGGRVSAFDPLAAADACPRPGAAARVDSDGDGFRDADELENGTDRCNPAHSPPDEDGDLRSDLLDRDRDNDGVPDVRDPFQTDPSNGRATRLPFVLDFTESFNGGVGGTGFAGVQPSSAGGGPLERLVRSGGGGGYLSIQATPGTSRGAANDQNNALQQGFDATRPFTITAELVDPLGGDPPGGGAPPGIAVFFGPGEDDQVTLTLSARGDGAALVAELESAGRARAGTPVRDLAPPVERITLALEGDAVRGEVRARYREGSGPWTTLGRVAVPRAWFTRTAPAGVAATSGDAAGRRVFTLSRFAIARGPGGSG